MAQSDPNDDTLGTSPDSKSKASGGNMQLGLAVLILVPWLMFAMVSIVFAIAYHHYAIFVWFLVLAMLMVVFTFFALDSRKRMGGSWFKFLGFLSLFAVVNGALLGSYNYWTYLFQYWSYSESATYTNVLPTQAAGALSDAGKIVFADTARVDTSRALGFKVSNVYCVAPILDDTQMNHVEFWAAGVDCCPARGDFTCDETWNPKAKSGVVIFGPAGDASSSRTHTGVGVELWHPIREYYLKAVHAAEAAYSLTSSKDPLFIRWVRSPQFVQDDYWRGGVGFLVASVCVYLLISLIAGGILQMWSRRTAAAENAKGISA
eukprot:gnl/MRDRNA2_/MRDRNA2_121585_c0_seq1.p1 gnl/MRDRNA2_/MRDRNA2_121585_c0~~gnl/MRDRNA2_/MRDRNA2_121585_c0_seq1.p1  ORF type:complete len:319 (+),score=50.77 gnl/MRDRNA2_/MRDRNA2_121585_c0_seq1:218-1174(+)